MLYAYLLSLPYLRVLTLFPTTYSALRTALASTPFTRCAVTPNRPLQHASTLPAGHLTAAAYQTNPTYDVPYRLLNIVRLTNWQTNGGMLLPR